MKPELWHIDRGSWEDAFRIWFDFHVERAAVLYDMDSETAAAFMSYARVTIADQLKRKGGLANPAEIVKSIDRRASEFLLMSSPGGCSH